MVYTFWATVCKTVRPYFRTVVCLSVCPVLTVTLVYCVQAVGLIKMKLGVQIGIGPSHIAWDGDPAPPSPKGHSSQFLAHMCCGQVAGLVKTPVGREVGLGPSNIVLDGDPAPLPKKMDRAPPQKKKLSAHVYCCQTA